MIILQTGPDGGRRAAAAAKQSHGPVFKSDPGLSLEHTVARIAEWMASNPNPGLIVVDPASVSDETQRAALLSLRRMAKFSGVDVHLVGDSTIADLADRTIEQDSLPEFDISGQKAAQSAMPGVDDEPMTPFRRVDEALDIPTWEEIVSMTGCSKERAQDRVAWMRALETHVNNLYQVNIERGNDGRTAHLIIRRIDKQPARNWIHFQEIKNQLIGPECEAVELYPPESQLVDAKNQYHLWAFTSPEDTFGVGFRHGREVQSND